MDIFVDIKAKINNLRQEKRFQKKNIQQKLERIENKLNSRYEETEKMKRKGIYNSSQYKEAFEDLLIQINQFVQYEVYKDIEIKVVLQNLEIFDLALDKIEILERLAITKKNIVIIGANGSGKSSFVSSLKNSLITNMVVIPAQKSLFFYSNASEFYAKSKIDVNEYQNKDFISFSRNANDHYNIRINHLDKFTILLTALANDYVNHVMQIYDGNNTIEKDEIIFNKLRYMWGILIPSIKLDVNSTYRTIYAISNENSYDVNALSDGEKCILYFLANILMAAPNSYIIVDEPETFLNPSVYNKLWDLLTDERKDCQFIFCSHNIDFITSRLNTTLVWSKKFEFPTHWEIEFISDIMPLPASILAELLGSRKQILFCEGDDKNSIDYKIYSSVFLDKYTIFPSGGHPKVIEYVRSFNTLDHLHNNKACGIIDSDLLPDEIIEKYQQENIYTLPFNEIEMLLFTDEIMRNYFQDIMEEEAATQKIERFKKEFFKLVADNKEKIALAKIKKIIDLKLANYRLQAKNSLSELLNEYNNLSAIIDAERVYSEIINSIDDCLSTSNYKKLLEICNLKEQVSKGLANKYLDSNYIDKAIYKIRSNVELNSLLKKVYFDDLGI